MGRAIFLTKEGTIRANRIFVVLAIIFAILALSVKPEFWMPAIISILFPILATIGIWARGGDEAKEKTIS
ncbi:MAG: hypothetical protein KBB86_00990 [Candidatus Pacebacteria bacterium]|nr:hypothetical protein [Candidatus Paceibacterota bacterium]